MLRAHGVAIALAVGATVGLEAIVFGGESAISSTAFCTSCHSMSYPAKELRKSNHYGVMGADPDCRQCHIPRGLANFPRAVWIHVVDGARGLVREFTVDYSTRKKFNKRRLKLAQHVRMTLKGWDSVTCRACHRHPRPSAKSAKRAHKKMETEGATCIDCHQNLVHKAVEETDLDASLAQGRMVIREEE